MLMACRGLEQTLKDITRCIVEGEMSDLAGLLSKRKALMDEIQAATPPAAEAEEVAEVLGAVIALEELVTGLAREKKQKIMEELNDIRCRKKANAAYGSQCLKGVRS